MKNRVIKSGAPVPSLHCDCPLRVVGVYDNLREGLLPLRVPFIFF